MSYQMMTSLYLILIVRKLALRISYVGIKFFFLYLGMLSDLSIVIGSTLQIIPAGNMPTYTKKRPHGKLVIINLQPTKHDKKADMVIRCYADKVFEMLFKKLNQGCTFFSIGIIGLEIIYYCPFRNTWILQRSRPCKEIAKRRRKYYWLDSEFE